MPPTIVKKCHKKVLFSRFPVNAPFAHFVILSYLQHASSNNSSPSFFHARQTLLFFDLPQKTSQAPFQVDTNSFASLFWRQIYALIGFLIYAESFCFLFASNYPRKLVEVADKCQNMAQWQMSTHRNFRSARKKSLNFIIRWNFWVSKREWSMRSKYKSQSAAFLDFLITQEVTGYYSLDMFRLSE